MNERTGRTGTEIVLVGAGHSHLEVLRRFGRQPQPGVRLTLISRDPYATYSGMLPGVVAGHYTLGDARIELSGLARHAGARWHREEMTGLDPEARWVECGGHRVSFDLLSINTGSLPASDGVAGAALYANPVKPIDAFLEFVDGLSERHGEGDKFRVAVVGGGAAGVEIALSLQYRLRQASPGGRWRFSLVTEGPEILPGHNGSVRKRFMRILRERGVQLYLRHRVTSVDQHGLACHAGRHIDADAVVWLTHAAPPDWLAASGLARDGRGFIQVNDFLQSTSHPCVFAAGDVAGIAGKARPKSGVFAVRQGPPLWRNLCLAAAGGPLRPFVPQRAALALISCGDRYAVGSRGGWAAEGAWVWRLKDWIDRRFMAKYRDPA